MVNVIHVIIYYENNLEWVTTLMTLYKININSSVPCVMDMQVCITFAEIKKNLHICLSLNINYFFCENSLRIQTSQFTLKVAFDPSSF